ncbi:MAG: glycoside hydrolase family 97 N-terminal domain-containing protein, partial [Limisphaerales bacterium]
MKTSALIVGQASSLPDFSEKQAATGRQDACPTIFFRGLKMKSFRSIAGFKKFLPLIFLLIAAQSAFAGFAFVHPGLLQNREDLERMKTAVAQKQEPIYSGYEIFCTNVQSQLNYKMRGPLAMVSRNPTAGQPAYDSDANAAYQCAIQWCITGDIAYAKKSEQIIDAWSSTLKSITGRDAVLMAGLGPFKMVNAAEILRYTDTSWPQPKIQQAEHNFREVIYPAIKNFAPFANGNWDTAAIKTMMAIGVFCNDRAMFERALDYYVNGAGDGRLTHYIINETGECQESGRDQQHTQLGLAHLGDCCEIAWHQGLNLYGYNDNLLLKGFEYTAKYNLGEEVPFEETLDRTGKYHHKIISPRGRGRFRAVWEEIYNAYANRLGISAPFTKQVVEKIRPEGVGVPSAPNGADHVGFGTLLFAQTISNATPTQIRTAPAAPAGMIAKGSPKEIKLTWIASVGAKSYTVKRATENGDYKIIARNGAATIYTDKKIKPGEIYHYVISASNTFGESLDSFPVSICAGLPKAWTHQDIGAVSVAGDSNFNGKMFKLEGAGKNIGGTNDEFQFAFAPVNGNCTIVARFVPQTSSQFSKFGLMMRATTAADAANVSFLISPQAGRNIEAPGWRAELSARKVAGAETTLCAASENFSEPAVTFGRLTGFVWLKLQRSGGNFIGSISLDGKSWTQVGSATVALKQKLFVGLAVCSRLPKITTTVKFDNVTMTDGKNLSAENQIKSPDGKLAVDFFLQTNGIPAYAIEYLGKPIVLESRLGLEPMFTNDLRLVATSTTKHSGSWTNVFGERRIVPNNYNELNVDLKNSSDQQVRVTFRAYDEGAAFRYSFPKQDTKEFHLTGERSEFHFPENTFCYEEHGTEGKYHRVNVSDIAPWCERPLTLEFASGLFAALGEADNDNYPRMLLSASSETSNTLVTALGGTTSNTAYYPSAGDPTATLQAGDSTPWRWFIVGEKPGDLLERNYLVLNLNPSCALKNISWIKPGKVMRDTTLTTANSEAIIDFAAIAGLKYVELDSGWYGAEDYDAGDATTPRAGRTRFGNPPAPMDIQELVRYGRKKNVGLILYVDRRQIKKQRDILFPLYEKWGVAGVKIGFVDVGPQTETAWVAETIKKAAEHH